MAVILLLPRRLRPLTKALLSQSLLAMTAYLRLVLPLHREVLRRRHRPNTRHPSMADFSATATTRCNHALMQCTLFLQLSVPKVQLEWKTLPSFNLV